MPSSGGHVAPPALSSCPTRRSSDLITAVFCDSLEVYHADWTPSMVAEFTARRGYDPLPVLYRLRVDHPEAGGLRADYYRTLSELQEDRKSTRLNSSHVAISYAVFWRARRPPRTLLLPYTPLFRSHHRRVLRQPRGLPRGLDPQHGGGVHRTPRLRPAAGAVPAPGGPSRGRRAAGGLLPHALGAAGRSEEHTSELQSRGHLVCRLLAGTSPPPHSPLALHAALPISSPPCSATASRSTTRTGPPAWWRSSPHAAATTRCRCCTGSGWTIPRPAGCGRTTTARSRSCRKIGRAHV